MVNYYGDFPVSAVVYIPINTFDSNDPAASVTATNLANTDVHIHKDGSTTQRNNAAGITMTIDFDTITGNHLLAIDTSDNTVADFYQAGHEYQVRVEGVTVDGGTLNSWVGAFSIERAGGALALLKSATYGLSAIETLVDGLETDTTEILTRLPDATAGANGGLTICGSNAATTFATLSITGQLDAGNLLVDTTTVLTGNVSMSGTLTVTGATTLTGNVALGNGLTITQATGNGVGLSITGNGTGQGVLITGGGTSASGIAVVAGAPNGIGIYLLGDGSGSGLRIDGGDGDGPGITINGGASNGAGVVIRGDGTGHGLSIFSGDGATGNGLNVTASSTNGFGVYVAGAGSGDGMSVVGGITGDGLSSVGGGTSGNGIYAKAAGTGHGFAAHGGGVAGDGLHAEADNDGDGIEAIGVGAGNEDITGTLADPVTIAVAGIPSGANAAAELNAIADAVLDRNMATGTDSGTNTTVVRTPRQALRVLRNKRAVAAGTLTVTKEDDATSSWTAAVVTAASDPVSSVDPT